MFNEVTENAASLRPETPWSPAWMSSIFYCTPKAEKTSQKSGQTRLNPDTLSGLNDFAR
jgi:hypothetical protein